MKLIINGKEEIFEKKLTIQALLEEKKVKFAAVELNDAIIDRDKFAETEIKDGDKVEIVVFLGGG